MNALPALYCYYACQHYTVIMPGTHFSLCAYTYTVSLTTLSWNITNQSIANDTALTLFDNTKCDHDSLTITISECIWPSHFNYR